MTDVTEFNVAGQKLFLSPVMDLYNGEIIAFETARRPMYKLVETMLIKAVSRLRDDDRAIPHSDQGWQHQMPTWQRMLRAHNINQSMSRKGNCLDNAAMESFFATLKSVFFHQNRFDSVNRSAKPNCRYIRYYNHDRIKLKLKRAEPCTIQDPTLKSSQPMNRPTFWSQFIN